MCPWTQTRTSARQPSAIRIRLLGTAPPRERQPRPRHVRPHTSSGVRRLSRDSEGQSRIRRGQLVVPVRGERVDQKHPAPPLAEARISHLRDRRPAGVLYRDLHLPLVSVDGHDDFLRMRVLDGVRARLARTYQHVVQALMISAQTPSHIPPRLPYRLRFGGQSHAYITSRMHDAPMIGGPDTGDHPEHEAPPRVHSQARTSVVVSIVPRRPAVCKHVHEIPVFVHAEGVRCHQP